MLMVKITRRLKTMPDELYSSMNDWNQPLFTDSST